MTDNKYWLFLEELRKSGVTNMFGAAPFLHMEFGMSYNAAIAVLKDWMLSYSPDDYK